MPKAFFNYPQDSACPYHRLLMPARYCGEYFRQRGWEIECGEGLPKGYDVYAFHGLPNELALFEVAKLKRKGAKFIWSVDDDWLSIPEWNPAKPGEQGMVMYELAKQLADWILVSTPALASTFFDVSRKVVEAPNLIDVKAFPTYEYEEQPDGSRNYNLSVDLPVRVVWTGGPTHKEDVLVMEEALYRLLEKYSPDRCVVVFNGMAPPPKLLTRFLHKGLLHQPQVTFAAYQKIVNSVKPDVYLAPLSKVDFNLSKSNLRIMEGWALMAPPVATSWGEYDCVENGVDGRLVGDDPEAWYSALQRMVTDHEYRLTLAVQGRQRVEREYDWNSDECRKPWYQALSQIFELPYRG